MQIDKLIKEVSTDNLSGQQCAFSRNYKRNNKDNWKRKFQVIACKLIRFDLIIKISILKYSIFCSNYELVISIHFLLLHAVGDENEEYLVFSFIQNNLSW